ncbi:hypothetical protein [Paenibacillus agricola]|uniref:hypothetical protein n=1 Tax=Paenibacillus agricola TaxID=2716264 RepID=UPI001A9D4D04|nr:hypothetical protein [Paenibacillus agricola]
MLYGLTYASTLWQDILLAAGMGWGLYSSVEGIGVIIGPVLGDGSPILINERTAFG